MKKRIQQYDFQKYNYLSELKSNSDNTKVGFIVTRINEEKDCYYKSLYIYDDEKVTKFKDGIQGYTFDGENILAKSVTKFETKFTRYNMDGEVLKEFTLPLVVGGVRPLNSNGDYILTCKTDLNCPDYYKLSLEEQEKYQDQVEEDKYFHILDEYPFWFNAQGYVNKTRTAIFLYNEISGEIKKVTEDSLDLVAMDVYKNHILYAGKAFDVYKGFDSQVYRYDIETGETEVLYSREGLWISRIFYKDGVPHVGGTFGLRHGPTEHPIFYRLDGRNNLTQIIDPDMGAFNMLSTDCRYGGLPAYINHEGKPYFIATNETNAIVFSFEGDKLEKVIDIAGSTDSMVFLNGKMITIGFYDVKLQEIYEVSKDGSYKQISTFNEFIQEEYEVSRPIFNRIHQENYDVDGFIMLPYGYDPNKKYPLICDIHGGPKGAWGGLYSHEMQTWAAMGYFVVYCNPKGSDGKGNFFTDIRGGVYGSTPFDDIMKFIDSAIEKYPAIDEKRMAVTGGSYGGYMTNYCITHTDRFACAISYCSISNWVSMALVSDCGVDFPMKMKVRDITDCHDELWSVSPLKDACKVTTPTLFVHGLEDYRCPIVEAIQLYTAIKLNGVDSRILALEGENHELARHGKPKSRRKRFEETNNWLMKYTQE